MLEIHCSGKELPLSSAHFLKYFKASHLETISPQCNHRATILPPELGFQGLVSVGRFWVVLFSGLWPVCLANSYLELWIFREGCELMILSLHVPAFLFPPCSVPPWVVGAVRTCSLGCWGAVSNAHFPSSPPLLLLLPLAPGARDTRMVEQ